MTVHPQYFGVVTHMGDLSQLHVDAFFVNTPVKEWKLSRFLQLNSDHDSFLSDLATISCCKAVDPAIRSFVRATSKFYEGDLGQLRIQLARQEARNFIESNILASKERSLAQAMAINAVEDELQEEQRSKDSNKAAKRPLEQGHQTTDQPASKRVHPSRSPTVGFEDFPFESSESGAATETEDHVTLAEQNSYRNLGIVFDSDHDFEFECRVGALDLSEEFNKYYDQAIAGKYDPNNFQDLLACGGILFMDRGPTPFQHDAFKDEYNTMLNTIHDHIQWASRQDEQDAIDLCRKARSAHREEMRQGTPESARQAIRRVIRGEAESPLTELLDRASRMGKDWKPTSEVDHKSGFILPMLEPLFNRPDATRIAHAATTPSYSPLFIRLCDNFDTKPKTPDIPIRHLEKRDIGVGEVSFEKEFSKDRLDLCRAALLSKRILDQLVTTFSGLDRISIVFFQVVEQKCEFYQMMRCGTVCVASPIGGLTIAYTLDEILKGFEDDCNTWITVCNVFDSLVDSLAAARVRVDSKPGPPVFVGLTTPRSRHMMSDTKRQ